MKNKEREMDAENTKFYNKIRVLSSIQPTQPIQANQLTEDDIYEICQYSHFSIMQNNPNLIKKVSEFRDNGTGDTCLHIAAKSSNKSLVTDLVVNKIINPNVLNNRKQNPLMCALSYNSEFKSEKIAAFLTKFTDLSARNIEGNLANEVEQAAMNPARARILENIKKMNAGK